MGDNALIDYSKKEITRNSPEYNKFKKKVKLRDSFCQCCGSKENLEVHHSFSYNEYVDLRADVKNGVVLCEKCHKKYHKQYGRKKNNNPITFAQFLRDNSTFRNVQTSFDNLLNDEKILKRDKKCMHVMCGTTNNLEVHHDKNISDGGITLCKKCHEDYHHKYGHDESCNAVTLDDFLIPDGIMVHELVIKRNYTYCSIDGDSIYRSPKYGDVVVKSGKYGVFYGDSYIPSL